MMKKWLSCLALALLMAVSPAALAEDSVFTMDLSEGMNGNDVKRLQQLLVQYGFYGGVTDGMYGPEMVEAVKGLESYLQHMCEYEQACQMEALKPTPAPTPVPTPVPEGEEPEEAEETPQPEITPVPAAYLPGEPAVYEADGVAELDILRMMESGAIDFYVGEVEPMKKNEDARRAQTRLIYLGYLDGTADGMFGENSMAAMREFQRDNGLEVTGLPNGESRLILYDESTGFSDKPVYNMLVPSDLENTQVMNVQKALNTFGFTLEVPDGLYGSNTEEMMTNFKNYLFEIGRMNARNEIGGEPVYGEDGAPLPLEKTTSATNELQTYLLDGGFDVFHVVLEEGSTHTSDVIRLQNRLFQLGFLIVESRVDGQYGGKTIEGVSNFQKRNGLPVTGVADETTQRLLFSEEAKKVLKPYQIEVSLDEQRVYVYSYDHNEEYTVLEHTFVVSTGTDETPTPTGTFEFTGKGERWHYFAEFDSWAQYAFHIDGGIMFHSVIYNEQDETTLQPNTLKYLGYKASHGCIRMQVEDAKWIWDNCPTRTTVIIY